MQRYILCRMLPNQWRIARYGDSFYLVTNFLILWIRSLPEESFQSDFYWWFYHSLILGTCFMLKGKKKKNYLFSFLFQNQKILFFKIILIASPFIILHPPPRHGPFRKQLCFFFNLILAGAARGWKLFSRCFGKVTIKGRRFISL